MMPDTICDIEPITLTDAPKGYTFDQDKIIHPGETVARAAELIKSVFPSESLAFKDIGSARFPLSAYRFVTPYYTSNGKGITPQQAKASAIMEFAERFSWISFDYKHTPGFTIETHHALKDRVSVIPKSYFASNTEDVTDELLEEITDTVPLKWVPAYSLLSNEFVYYPINWHNIACSSNGLSAGNSMEEAILQGICELIERHNFDIFLDTKTPCARLDLESVNDHSIERILESAHAQGIELHCFDISYDLRVPTIAVCGYDRNTQYDCLREGWGFGTHTNPVKALYRAVTEYFMGRLMVEMNAAKVDAAFKSLRRENLGFVLNMPLATVRAPNMEHLAALNDCSDNNIKNEILAILDLFRARHMDCLIMRKTYPSFNIPVVRVVAVGLTFLRMKIAATYSAHFVLAQMCYEADMKKKAEVHLIECLKRSSTLSGYFDIALKSGTLDFLFKSDYQSAIRQLFLLKSNGNSVR